MQHQILPHQPVKPDSGFIEATLPINLANGLFLDSADARSFGASLNTQYVNADPFPHIVIDGFLPPALADLLLDNFPADSGKNEVHFLGRTFEHKKRQIFPNDCNELVRGIFAFLNSGPILEFLESLTGIDSLIADPHFDGGGFHEISRGGRLGLHADFRTNRRLHLNRRLNLLIYLNKNWMDSYSGNLELWDKTAKNKIRSIAPVFNRCVVFSTARDSFHGHPDPLTTPESITRKSAAMYYYTASKKLYEETPPHGTVFAARPNDARTEKREALRLKLRTTFTASELLPPILYRRFRSIRDKIKPPQIPTESD